MAQQHGEKPGYKAGAILKALIRLIKRPLAGPIFQLILCIIGIILSTNVFVWIWDTLLFRLGVEIPSSRFTTLIDWKMWIFLAISYVIWVGIFTAWFTTLNRLESKQLLFFGRRIIVGFEDVYKADGTRDHAMTMYAYLTEGTYAIPFLGSIFSLSEQTIVLQTEAHVHVNHKSLTKQTASEKAIEWLIELLFVYRIVDAGRYGSLDAKDVAKTLDSNIKNALTSLTDGKSKTEMYSITADKIAKALSEDSELQERLKHMGIQPLYGNVEYRRPANKDITKMAEKEEIQRNESRMLKEQAQAILERAVNMAGGPSIWATLKPTQQQKYLELSQAQDPSGNVIYFAGGDPGAYAKGKAVEKFLDKKGKRSKRGDDVGALEKDLVEFDEDDE
jgi:signal transduction histidine kinase